MGRFDLWLLELCAHDQADAGVSESLDPASSLGRNCVSVLVSRPMVENGCFPVSRIFTLPRRQSPDQLEERRVLIETTLISSDGVFRESISLTIPDDEWGMLILFIHHVAGLRATRFVREGHGGNVKFTWKHGEAMRVSGNVIDEEPVWAMLHKLRPFVLQKERCYLPKILKILKRRLAHVAFQRHLDMLRDAFFLKSMDQRIRIRGPGRPPLSQAVVMDWLNSYQYHYDDAKGVAVNHDLGPLAGEQNGMPIAVFALVDMVQAVLDTGGLVETLQLCADGSMPEILCPPHYFDAN